jgi:serine/threonine protein kinase
VRKPTAESVSAYLKTMPLGAGDRIGPYEIVAPIGAGGMREMYRARDTRLGRDIALKILPAEFADDASRRQRFETEPQVAALNRPNIVAVFDVGTAEGISYIVTELVDGEPRRISQVATRHVALAPLPRARPLELTFSGPPVHSPSLRPDDLLTVPRTALSMDFRVRFPSSDHPSYRALTFTLAGLTPAEYDSLRWTYESQTIKFHSST